MAGEDEDFEFQLRQQQLHGETGGQQPEGDQSDATYTDPSDGTVYEWVAEKRAWFPKASRICVSTSIVRRILCLTGVLRGAVYCYYCCCYCCVCVVLQIVMFLL